MQIPWLKYLRSKFSHSPQKEEKSEFSASPDMEMLTQIAHASSSYYNRDDLVYFDQMNVWGAFKYDIVKDIMLSGDFGTSPMHLELNHVYFQTDEARHQHNKKITIKNLEFVSKELQFRNDEYTTYVFDQLFKNLTRNQEFNLVDELINPLVFICALHDLGLLGLLTQFDVDNESFNLNAAIEEIRKLFERRECLEEIFKTALQNGELPPKMQNILDNLSTEEPYEKEYLPKFFTSMVFAASESVASFMTSFIYFLFRHYPGLLETNDWKKLEQLANEVLRIYVPTPMAFRTVIRDFNYRGQELKAGDLVVLFIRAANLDASVFNDPMNIQFGREEKHMSFGRGRLACIGQFASFRITMNVVKELFEYRNSFYLLDEVPAFDTIGMFKIKWLNAKLND